MQSFEADGEVNLLSGSVQREKGSFFLELTAGMRKAALLHTCHPNTCSVDTSELIGAEEHGEKSSIDGGGWYILSRAKGYPPRSA